MDKMPKVWITVTNSAEAVWMHRSLLGISTQREYAGYIGMPPWVISDWESGRDSKWEIPQLIWRHESFKQLVAMDIALRFERWRRGITMETLGALLGVSKQTINDWESLRYGWTNLAKSWGLI
jgi:DNA-binding transcriptional regulator YiaG